MIQLATEKGHLEVLKWAREQGIAPNVFTNLEATRQGNLEMLKWGLQQKCSLADCLPAAASSGHLEIVEWLWDHGADCCGEWSCWSAAANGNLEVLKWLREKGCPWSARTCIKAAEGGHLEVLKWAREQGCPWDQFTWDAAEGGHLEVLKWLREKVSL